MSKAFLYQKHTLHPLDLFLLPHVICPLSWFLHQNAHNCLLYDERHWKEPLCWSFEPPPRALKRKHHFTSLMGNLVFRKKRGCLPIPLNITQGIVLMTLTKKTGDFLSLNTTSDFPSKFISVAPKKKLSSTPSGISFNSKYSDVEEPQNGTDRKGLEYKTKFVSYIEDLFTIFGFIVISCESNIVNYLWFRTQGHFIMKFSTEFKMKKNFWLTKNCVHFY